MTRTSNSPTVDKQTFNLSATELPQARSDGAAPARGESGRAKLTKDGGSFAQLRQASYAAVAQEGHLVGEHAEDRDRESFWGGSDEDYAEENEEQNEIPYAHSLDVEAGQYVTSQDLQAQLAHLPLAPKKPSAGMRSETLIVDRNIIASRILHLQQRGIILYTVDFNPTTGLLQRLGL